MANQIHLDLLRSSGWDKWIEQYPDLETNLSGANLKRYDIEKVVSYIYGYGIKVRLTRVNLSGLDLKYSTVVNRDSLDICVS